MQERLTVLKMNTDKHNTYSHYLKEAVHLQDVLTAAEAKSETRGKVEEAEQRNKEVAINMLKQNLDAKLIASVTGLSKDEIHKLKSKLQIAS